MNPAGRARIVIAGWGSAGDMMPLIGVGAELRRRGHEVHLAANAAFARAAEDADLSFTEVGNAAAHARLMADQGLFGAARKDWEALYAEHYFPLMPAFHAAVDRLSAGRGPTVVLGDEVGATAVAEQRGLPRVRVAVSSVRFFSRSDPPHPEMLFPGWARPITRWGRGLALFYRAHHLRHGIVRWPARVQRWPAGHPVAQFRESLGLPGTTPVPARRVLCLWPEWFSPPQADWPAGAVTSSFPLPAVSEWSDAPPDAGERPIIATTGSIAGSQQAFYAAIVEACRLLRRPAWLVTPHADHIPADLPPHVRHLPFVPFREAFGHASLVVHHGGIGTASYALAAGTPQLVVPMRGDQFDNGNRMTRLGVASMIQLDHSRPQRLAALMDRLVRSKRVAARCRYWQRRLGQENGLSRAAEQVEAIVPG